MHLFSKKQIRLLSAISFVLLISLLSIRTSLSQNKQAIALDNDFSDGITVDSTLDTPDTNIGNGICDDGAGNCTLRAAIQEANSNPDPSTINFNITGTPDFTNGGQDGYTISPTSGLPAITSPVTIDGYSQPGAQQNTTVAPNPFDAVLLIELDGSGAGAGDDVFRFESGSNSSQVRGLVVGSFSESIAISINADNIEVRGNYIGVDPIGLSARPNEVGVSHSGISGSGPNALIGGLSPEDRNIISGNTDGYEAAAGYPSTGWIIQGNYVGVGSDGITALPNGAPGGSGAFSIDDCFDVLVGGTSTGAINVISGNTSSGIAPHNSPALIIQGNYIGVDWMGENAVPNEVGILLSDNQTDSLLGGTASSARNIISGNTVAGIVSATYGNMLIQGNYIGLDVNGSEAVSNGAGALIADNAVLGGSESGRNVVSGNTLFNVSVQGMMVPTSGAEISGNYIGTNASGDIDPSITMLQGEGIRVSANTSANIIGGTSGNLIAGNKGAGVSVRSLTINQFGITATPSKNAILGNQIYGNEEGGPVVGLTGLGIDHYEATIDSFLSIPADLYTDSHIGSGPGLNDPSDSDSGPNGYINFPVLNSILQTNNQVTINFDLDSADSPTDQYRVEFFANDEPDSSGYGEGQSYLGHANVANGNNQEITLTIPNGIDLSSKSISATTTAIDSTTVFGFGGTSEFSAVVGASSTGTTPESPQQNNPTDPATDSSVSILGNTGKSISIMLAMALIFAVASFLLRKKLNKA
jgi:CSLREA domain-containing protein